MESWITIKQEGIGRGNWKRELEGKFIAERIISYNGNENSGIWLTNRDFHLQTGNLGYKTGLSFTKRESWVTNGILSLLFTPHNVIYLLYFVIYTLHLV